MSNLTVELFVSQEPYFIKFVELQLNYSAVSQQKKKKNQTHRCIEFNVLWER